MRAGQEIRMIDVPIDAGAGMGGIENLHEFDSPAELAEALKNAMLRHYGVAGREWLAWCAANFKGLSKRVHELIERYRYEFVPEAASGQVRTVGSRFALIAAAGELATAAGVTGWDAGEASRAARRCFEAWLAARGHLDNGEDEAMVRQVRAWVEKNGDALLTWCHRALDDHRANTPMRGGFKRLVGADGVPLKFDSASDYLERRGGAASSERSEASVEYLIFPEAWRTEVCKGFDADAVAKVMRTRGYIKHEPDRLTIKHRLPGMGKTTVFHVLPSIFEG
jgi:putative DNA primase/helicase